MDDLVKRLREPRDLFAQPTITRWWKERLEAADRIAALEARVAAADKRIEYLERWQAAAFMVYGNLDLDIEANLEARAIIEPAPQEPEKYTIGNLTMDRVFQAAELTNVSDMQAVFDQVEVALRHAIKPAPVSVREAALVVEGAIGLGATLRKVHGAAAHRIMPHIWPLLLTYMELVAEARAIAEGRE